ncbi:MAG: InlB B-repeat-containing protein, partial [Clostridia bacterium]|nr:InlB B-repeat-containing protein [Clostridia bacterium]
NGDFTIRVQEAYAIIPEANQFCNFSQLSNKAAAGEVVSLDLSCRYGYKIVGAKVTDVNGNEIPLTGLSFQMPQTAVSVVLQVEQIVYTLTFMVDGEVWHTAQYYAGEVISLPENPTKEANGEYVYTFTGWGNVPAVAAGEEENLVFEASWAESTTMNDYDSGHNNNVLFGVVVPCVLAAIVLVIGFFVLRKQAKKMGGWRVLWVKVLATLKKWFNILKSQINKLFKNTNKPTQSKK